MISLSQVAVIIGIATPVIGGGGYALKYFADNEYVRQEVWVQENRRERRREIQFQIDELEFISTERPLNGKEAWQLKRLKSEKAAQ